MTEASFTWMRNKKIGRISPKAFSEEATAGVRRLHRMLPEYAATPLTALADYAAARGVRAVLVKDESLRFGLNAFKALGGVYAMYKIICRRLKPDGTELTLEEMQREPYRTEIAQMVFVTATDGNHGKGVAWAAGIFGCRARVLLPAGSVPVRAEAIRETGNAEAVITELDYDGCVVAAAELSRRNGWLLIQDTSLPGYEEIPLWIMQGYTTLLYEMREQLQRYQPTHVFLQAGVGAMAAAVTGALYNMFADDPPYIFTVEPLEAACIYESVKNNDALPRQAAGSGRTVMAGLNCATPCGIAWEILRNNISAAFSCHDSVTEHGMRLLANHEGMDPVIVSGESGAVTMGLTDLLLQDEEQREALGIDESSVILLISTEGATDPENYARVTGKR